MRIEATSHGLEGVGQSPGGRSHEKLHMSDLYGRYFATLDPKKYSHDSAPNPLYLEAGLAFEQLLEKAFVDRHTGERPGEMTTEEGVVFSPDLLLFDEDGSLRLGEIKLTWLSCRDCPISEQMAEDSKAFMNGQWVRLKVNWDGVSDTSFSPKFDKYFCQIKAYAKHLETRKARLIAYFVNGDYKPPRPVILAWNLEFTQCEIDENWQTLLWVGQSEGML